jgi:methanogenic corrinoid protein MtbC1
VEFAERNNIEPSGTLTFQASDTLGKATEMALLSRDYPALAEIFTQKALTPDDMDLYAYLSYLYEHKMHLWEIYDHVVRPGMIEIGRRWRNGMVDEGEEHQASAETLQALAKLQAEILVKPQVGLHALFACVGDEQHEIGLRCASYLFMAEGWGAHYLGARTPLASVEKRIQRSRPAAICISVSESTARDVVRIELTRLVAASRAHGGMLIVGGGGASAELREQGVCDAVVSSTRDLLGLMAHLQDEKRQGAERPS